MPFRNSLLRFSAAMMVTILSVVFTGTTQAQTLELILDVGDTTALPGEQVTIPVYLSNFEDTVAGFNFWVQLDCPDIMEFTTVLGEFVDTTWWICTQWSGPDCIDSMMVSSHDEWDFMHIDTNQIMIGTIDSTGTLVAGWEYIDSRSLGGSGYDLNVVGLANLVPPPMTPGIPIQEGGILIKLVGTVYDIPDTMTERTVNIHVETNMLDHFSFSDPQGNSIGVLCDTIPDTSFWLCTNWTGDICLNWVRVYGPPYDSISVEGYDIICYLDTSVVHVFDGSVRVEQSILCGDVDCDGSMDIADLVYIVDYMFNQGPPPPVMAAADIDGSGGDLDIADLVNMVDYMFNDGPPPICR